MPSELAGGQDIKFEEPAYSMGAGAQGDFDSPVLRLRYSSLSTPSSTIDYNMQTGQRCFRPPSLPFPAVRAALAGLVPQTMLAARLAGFHNALC